MATIYKLAAATTEHRIQTMSDICDIAEAAYNLLSASGLM